MKIVEVVGDLFSAPDDFYFAHCVSADFKLGAGIAKQFDEKYDMRTKLLNRCIGGRYLVGTTRLIDRTFNLITKTRYWEKPTYDDFVKCIYSLKELIIKHHISNLAIPRLGCGLDQLDWNVVKTIIEYAFVDVDVNIYVYSKRGLTDE